MLEEAKKEVAFFRWPNKQRIYTMPVFIKLMFYCVGTGHIQISNLYIILKVIRALNKAAGREEEELEGGREKGEGGKFRGRGQGGREGRLESRVRVG